MKKKGRHNVLAADRCSKMPSSLSPEAVGTGYAVDSTQHLFAEDEPPLCSEPEKI